MKPFKMFSLAALMSLMATAFVGAPTASAGTTQLCSSDQELGTVVSVKVCTPVTHVHETTLSGAKATLLSSIINVTCDTLFLGDTLGEASPLVIHGNFTYTNCNNGECTVTEESADSLIEVLRTSHETSSVTGEGEVNVHCGFFINCTYNGEGLKGTGKGPLLSTETNGEVTLTGQETTRVSGFCPEHAFLDIKTTPLSATYTAGGLHYCVEYEHNTNGYYTNITCTEGPVAGRAFDLVFGPAGLLVNEKVCVRVPAGLWKKPVIGAGLCEEDAATLTGGLYEKGTIRTVQ